MADRYKPELGQFAFGAAWSEYECPDWVTDELTALLDAMGLDVYVEEFKCETFELFPYYWGDCTCGYDKLEAEWCEKNHHRPDCYQTELHARLREAGLEPWEERQRRNRPYEEEQRIEEQIYKELTAKYGLPMQGCAVHCTCDYMDRLREFCEKHSHDPNCPVVRPNFKYKGPGPLHGLEIRWYKYVGRSMSTNMELKDRQTFRKMIDGCIRAYHDSEWAKEHLQKRLKDARELLEFVDKHDRAGHLCHRCFHFVGEVRDTPDTIGCLPNGEIVHRPWASECDLFYPSERQKIEIEEARQLLALYEENQQGGS